MQIPNAISPVRWRPIGHGDQLSVVGHLDELRSRLIVCAGRDCGRVRDLLLAEPRAAAPDQRAAGASDPAAGTRRARTARRDLHRPAQHPRRRHRNSTQSPASLERSESPAARSPRLIARVRRSLQRDVTRAVCAARPAIKPVTLGIGEPFTTTHHRDTDLRADPVAAGDPAPGLRLPDAGVRPVPAHGECCRSLLAIPVLFAAGVAFGYVVVLPGGAALLSELQQRRVQRPGSGRASTTSSPPPRCWRWGCCSRCPSRSSRSPAPGSSRPRQLRHNRRYAILACGLVAAVLPGDAITMLLETLPLYVLFEASVLVASIADRRQRAREAWADSAERARSDLGR